MDVKQCMQLQAKRGAKVVGLPGSAITKSIEAVTIECRKHIRDNTEQYINKGAIERKEILVRLIMDYVMEQKPLVEGYMDSENRTDTIKLVEKLTDDITNYGIITGAVNNPDVFEIRCNGKELKVEISGKIEDLKDKDGNVLSFGSVEEQEIVMRKLLQDTRLTPKDALVSSSTIEGFRIAANHSSVMSPDPSDPTADRYSSFVLRKFKKSKMGLPEIVEKGTMSDGMARLLVLAVSGGLVFFTVGPTASGKTTTNNAILQSVPDDLRTILAQNPSEIDIRKRDAYGRVVNDVLHLEAKDVENPTPNDATMANVMDQILRLSPTLVCLGELRTGAEFKMGMKIMQAGHPINCTYHSESSDGAIERFLTAYADAGSVSERALKSITSLVNLIIVQKKLKDGTRKIVQISEIVGVRKDNPNEAEINDLYIFDYDEEPEYDERGRVVKMGGHHKRVGKLSEKMVRKMAGEGIAKRRFDFLMKPVDKDELETYTGENIDEYNMKLNYCKEVS